MILLLATFLSSVASAKVVTLKEVGAINCPSHILKPEDLEKCTDKAIIEQITKKVMDTTNRDIEILRKEIKKIEEKITSHSHCKCNSCKFSKHFYHNHYIVTIVIQVPRTV